MTVTRLAEQRAKEYIDAAVEKQARLGAKKSVPKTVYNLALRHAAEAVQELMTMSETPRRRRKDVNGDGRV